MRLQSLAISMLFLLFGLPAVSHMGDPSADGMKNLASVARVLAHRQLRKHGE
jgi:hypothetical protein